MMLIPFLIALIAPIGPLLPVQQDEDDAQADGNKLVKVSLVADRAEIQPGSTFTVAVKCRVERRWHVYWGENAGEAGLPISAEITGPPGWVIGPLRHPWPKREQLEGDIVEYVLEHEFAMLADVKVPADAKPGSQAAFEVKSRWLVCTTVCVPGAGSASLAVPVAEKEKPANDAEFKTWRSRLPRPWNEMTRTVVKWSGDASNPKLLLVAPGVTGLEFFPYKSDTTKVLSRKVDVGKDGCTLTLELEFSGKGAGEVPAARGVVWVKTEKGEAAYVLDQSYKKG
jgi:DsbC/DsbD-like thiol-disulfide interchange protein